PFGGRSAARPPRGCGAWTAVCRRSDAWDASPGASAWAPWASPHLAVKGAPASSQPGADPPGYLQVLACGDHERADDRAVGREVGLGCGGGADRLVVAAGVECHAQEAQPRRRRRPDGGCVLAHAPG